MYLQTQTVTALFQTLHINIYKPTAELRHQNMSKRIYSKIVNHEFAKKRCIRFIAPAAYNSTHGNIIDRIYS